MSFLVVLCLMGFALDSAAPNQYNQGHQYAVASPFRPLSKPKIYGTKVVMSIWQPKIEKDSGEFSLGQLWLASGSYQAGDLNSIEAGWQVYPHLYHDNLPRLFIFWTSDAYQHRKCYNLDCPGFIQTSRHITIGGHISPTSTVGGAQIEMTIHIYSKLGLWWLAVGFNNGSALDTVGYWPTEIFTRLTDHADQVQWGGEVTNINISNQHVPTEMGSGIFSDSGLGTAYMRGLEIAENNSAFQPVYDLYVSANSPYNIKKANNTCFFYGGPIRGRSAPLRFQSFILYFSFSIFFLF